MVCGGMSQKMEGDRRLECRWQEKRDSQVEGTRKFSTLHEWNFAIGERISFQLESYWSVNSIKLKYRLY